MIVFVLKWIFEIIINTLSRDIPICHLLNDINMYITYISEVKCICCSFFSSLLALKKKKHQIVIVDKNQKVS